MTTYARRQKLPQVCNSPSNSTLALCKYLESQNNESVSELIGKIETTSSFNPYLKAFERWKSLALGTSIIGECKGRLAIGLATYSPIEIGLALDHIYGVPKIPGTAIKGLLRRVPNLPDEAKITLFGDQTTAGSFVYYDAWYEPASGEGPFIKDVVTVHHQKYYASHGSSPPTDFDDPIPVPFLVIRPKSRFLFRVQGPTPEWEQYALQALNWALQNLGIGAKTNAGYGRMRLAIVQPSTKPEETLITWVSAALYFSPGNQEVSCRNGPLRASISFAQLQEHMPRSIKEQLTGKTKTAKANIQVKLIGGNNYEIVKVIEANAP